MDPWGNDEISGECGTGQFERRPLGDRVMVDAGMGHHDERSGAPVAGPRSGRGGAGRRPLDAGDDVSRGSAATLVERGLQALEDAYDGQAGAAA